MRFLHTADWHLGRVLHGASLLEDQAHVLQQIVGVARENRVDAVLIAGDIYDRAVPPPEAVELLDDILGELVLGVRVPVVMIAGNHDSPGRLGFAARLLREQRLVVETAPRAQPQPVVLGDRAGRVVVVPIPYADPAMVRERVPGADATDHDQVLRTLIRHSRAQLRPDDRAVLVAHAFVAGGTPSSSERQLAVGGSGQVGVRRFAGFDYVALGHLHRPQQVGSVRVQYSGAPLRYSFDEADGERSVQVVELGADRAVHVERIPLRPLRGVRRLQGTLDELLRRAGDDPDRDAYTMVTLDDRAPTFDAIGKLRSHYPNLLHLERPFLAAVPRPGTAREQRRLRPEVLFSRFFEQATGTALDGDQRGAFERVIQAMHEREVER